ncbi:MAG: hypothetical protein ACRCU3_11195 [Eubacteriaceae bacterium]
MLAIIFASSALAGTTNLPEGFLIGDKNGLTVTKDGNYFFNLTSIKPGDEIKRSLMIKNENVEEGFDLALLIEPISKTGTIDLTKELTLTLVLDGQEIYHGSVSGDQGEALILLGGYQSNEGGMLDISLKMSESIENWDYYSGKSVAEVQWTFQATAQKPNENIPIEANEKPKEEEAGKDKGIESIFENLWNSKSPKTGGAQKFSVLCGLMILMLISGSTLLLILKRRRKNGKQN